MPSAACRPRRGGRSDGSAAPCARTRRAARAARPGRGGAQGGRFPAPRGRGARHARAAARRGGGARRAAPRHDAAEKVARGSHRCLRRGRRPGSPLSRSLRRVRQAGAPGAQAPALVDPAWQRSTRRSIALEEARAALDAAHARRRSSIRASSSGSRSVCSRCGPRAENTTSRSTSSPTSRRALRRRSSPTSTRARSTLARLEAAARSRRTPPMRKGGEALRGAQARPPRRLDAAVKAELPPLKLERARFITEIDATRRAAAGRVRPGRVLGADQSGHAARPDDEGGLRRRALALHARPEGRARRQGLGADPYLRRDRYRRRRRGRGCDRTAPGAARAKVQVIAVTHAPQVAARRRDAFPHRQGSALARSTRVATRVTRSPPRPRREEIARMLAGATITDEARAAAARLLQSASA